MDSGDTLFSLYLFFVAAAYHRGPDSFNHVQPKKGDVAAYVNALAPARIRDAGFDDNGRSMIATIELGAVLTQLVSVASMTMGQMWTTGEHPGQKYPAS